MINPTRTVDQKEEIGKLFELAQHNTDPKSSIRASGEKTVKNIIINN
jgi:hypothetical protein